MNIAGFQKLTLLDFPGRVAVSVFTQGCILRCGYCHNPDLIEWKGDAPSSAAAVLEYLSERREVYQGVCVTGGEPTLHSDLAEFIKQIKSFGLAVKLDTSGVSPQRLKRLLDEGLLDYIAMDIKQVWEKYPLITRVHSPELIERTKASFDLVQQSGIDHEFRTTVDPTIHVLDDLVAIARQLVPGEKYYIQALRYEKTLDPHIRKTPFDYESAASTLRTRFPNLFIQVR